MATPQMKKFERLLKSYKAAAVADSHKGGGHPEDIPIIEKNLKKAAAKIRNHVAYIIAMQDDDMEIDHYLALSQDINLNSGGKHHVE